MQGTATFSSAGGGPRPSLAQRQFPRRVRTLLEGVLEYVADELDRGLVATLNEFEQQLFKLPNRRQQRCAEALPGSPARGEAQPRGPGRHGSCWGWKPRGMVKDPPRRESARSARPR